MSEADIRIVSLLPSATEIVAALGLGARLVGRQVVCRAVVQSLRGRYGALPLDTVIRENIARAGSPRFGKDIFSFRPRSFGAADYLNLSLEMMGRIAATDSVFSVERGVITTGATGGVAWS